MVSVLSSGSTLSLGLWVIFFASLALTVSLGLILAYHWFVHAHNAFASFVAISLYTGVSFVLLSTMTAAIVLLA